MNVRSVFVVVVASAAVFAAVVVALVVALVVVALVVALVVVFLAVVLATHVVVIVVAVVVLQSKLISYPRILLFLTIKGNYLISSLFYIRRFLSIS